MIWIYDIILFIYYSIVKSIAPFHTKANLFVQGRKATSHFVENSLQNFTGCVFIHVSSLGEFEQARPLIEAIKKRDKQKQIVLSFYSPSGYEVRKNFSLVDHVLYLPYDSSYQAKQLWTKLKPSLIIWVKYDFWLHHLMEANKQQIPLILICANFRKDQVFFRFYGHLFRKALFSFNHIFVQNLSSQQLLESIQIKSNIAFDTRFDRVKTIASESEDIPFIHEFKGNCKCIIGGSTWHEDEVLFQSVIAQHPDIKFILAPHHIDRDTIEKTLSTVSTKAILFSQKEKYTNEQVLIIDNMGMLAALYRYGDIGYVGGGFGVSVHNILEAAVYGIPIICGPHIHKSAEAIALQKMGGLFVIQTTTELSNCLNKLLQDQATLLLSGKINASYIEENVGGTAKIMEYIENNI